MNLNLQKPKSFMRVASILIGFTKNKFYALAFMLLLGFSFANAQTLDQQSLQENPDQWEISSTNAEIGQSFTAGYSGTLHSIVLNVITAGEPITFKIYDGEGFTGTVLSTQTVNVTSTGLLTIIPASTVNLTASNKYSFSMTPTGVFNLVWFKSSCCSDFYTGGSLYKNGAIFSPARDFLFTTYVNVAPANPTITLGTNPSVCFGSTSANLTYSATTNSPNQYSIDFDAAAETAGFVDVTLTSLPVSPISIVVPGAAAAAIYNATIIVKNTTSGLSSAGDAFTVTVNALPSAPTGTDVTACYDGSAKTGSASVGVGETVVWYDAATAGNVTTAPSGTTAGSYTAYAAAKNTTTLCQSATRTLVTVTINALPSAPTGTDVTACYDGSAKTGSASVGGGETVVWYDAATAGNVTTAPSGTTAGSYTAYAAAKNTTTLCVSATRTLVTVTINALPIAPTGTDVTACYDGSAKTGSASVGVGETVVWYDAATAGNVTTAPSGTTAGSYTAYAAAKNTTTLCESASRTLVTVTINALPTISSATKLSYNGADLTCFGQSNGQITVVGAGGTGALTYSNGGAYQVSNVFTGLAPNPYTLIVKDANGCLSTSSVVTINQPTALSGTVSNNGPICANTTLSLSGAISGGTGSLTYSWTGPNAYTSAASGTLARTVNVNATVAMSGLYTVTATDANNCTYNPTTNAVVNPIPTASISGTNSVCKDAPTINVTFTGANGTAPYTFTYNINGGGNLTISTASALDNSVDVVAPTNVSGTFTYSLVSVVDASSTLCVGSASGSAVVTIRPKPILSSNAAPVLNTICEGTSTTISCSNGTVSLSPPVYTTTYTNNFSSSIGSEWTFPAIVPVNVPTLKSYNGGSVLGYLSNQQAVFNKTGIPTHDFITIEFDLYIHDTWDGNSTLSGPDMWSMTVDGVNKINTTFCNETWNSTTQSYPNDFSASNPSFSSSITHVLPTACNFGGGSLSAKYHIIKTIPHTSASLNVILEAMGLENVCNESWSIDNFEVQYRSQTSSSNIVWTNPAVTNTSITVSPIVNTYYVATLGTCSDSIEILVNPTPRADFSINTVNQCVTSNSYNYTNASTLAGGGAMTYAWTMTGAATTSATTTNVTGNTYATYGDYNVQLVATSVIGNCNDSRGRKTKTVNVSPEVLITASVPNPVCVGTTVRLTANQVIGGSSALVYSANYSNNFESAIGSAWTFPANVANNTPTVQSYNGTNVLGYLTNQQAVYTQTGLAAHDYVKIEFDLYLHDSWDGNSTDIISGSLIGKDIWKMDVNGSSIINTTFSNFSYRTQAYPGNIAAVNPNGTDAVSNTLPTACNHNGGALSSVYHITKIIPHTTGSLNVVLEAMGLEELCNESWSIDNMDIQIGTNTATSTLLSACNGLGSGPVVYSLSHANDFNTAIGSAWTFPAVVPANVPELKTYNGASVMGYFTNQQAVYNQTGLTAHDYVKVEFDLYLHDSWDGNSSDVISGSVIGPDIWNMSFDGSSVINTTFSNFSYRTQAYPSNISATNANGTSALSNILPTTCNHSGGALSSKYHISKIVPHTASSLNLVLESMGLETVCNESWSIDNFEVYLGAAGGIASPATWSTAAVTCNIDVTPLTTTGYTTTIGACTSPSYSIDVRPVPTPSFTLNNGSCIKTVTFINTNIEADVNYSWNFGDGSAAYVGASAPAHLYANGTYTITLTASFGTTCIRTATHSITIGDMPTAGISFTGGTGCGNSVQFTNTSTIPSGNTPTYLWNFGETPIATTSTVENPLQSYLVDGTYTVNLTVTTGTTCVANAATSVTATAAITGNAAIFTATVSGACGNLVTTTNTSTGTGNVYAWDFGDGFSSNEVTPSHYYNTGGFKTITLSITNGVGCATTASKIVSISANSGATGRVGVDFTISPSNSQILLTNNFEYIPTFTNSQSNDPVLYCAGAPTWTYGDGTGSTYTNIYSKIYAAAGTYTVRIVQLTTNTGCYGEASKSVTVLPNPPFIQNQNNLSNQNIIGYQNVSASSTSVLNTSKNSAELTMYPNPNKGTFKVQVNNLDAKNGDLMIVDMLGREVYKSTYAVKSNNDIVEVNGLSIAPGTYHLVLSANGANLVRKSFVIIAE
ncbi:MAG: PKD domain-containing protein [Bacteroidia bacterium]